MILFGAHREHKTLISFVCLSMDRKGMYSTGGCLIGLLSKYFQLLAYMQFVFSQHEYTSPVIFLNDSLYIVSYNYFYIFFHTGDSSKWSREHVVLHRCYLHGFVLFGESYSGDSRHVLR